ncbi:hypothetical protein E2C01_024287 [Portunus trituberculatus]|uniref:Uncharacterized protein n=1 Tax=Portunus trituberculatus TaxID=210409 RepID=A0A5B7EDF4_PORTR|nr:hypothetical protein [Portunus trituberculatus]
MEESLAKGASEPIKHGCVCCRVHYSDANLSSSLKIFSERHSGLLAISLGKRITGPTCASRPSPAVLTSRDAAEGEDPSVNFGKSRCVADEACEGEVMTQKVARGGGQGSSSEGGGQEGVVMVVIAKRNDRRERNGVTGMDGMKAERV